MKMTSSYPPAVVLDLDFNGYGIVRSLAPYKVPVIGFTLSKMIPAAHSRLCCQIISFTNEEQLLEQLLQLSGRYNLKPVLFLACDPMVEFVSKHRKVLREKYLFELPARETTDLLFSKILFAKYAAEKKILVPKTIILLSDEDIKTVHDSFTFPIILKPYIKSEAWERAGQPKVYYFSTPDEFYTAIRKIKKIENQLIVQEFIPGGDENIEYCLTYFDGDGCCVTAFTGAKIRQWPVRTGSTAVAKKTDNKFLLEETLRIFQEVSFKGMGSIEYKKHAHNGKYYLMEPTVGRVNKQEYIATINGTNIPLSAYCSLTKIDITHRSVLGDNHLFIDELAEIRSALQLRREGELSLLGWINSLKGEKVFGYMNWQDPMVGVMMVLRIIAKRIPFFKKD